MTLQKTVSEKFTSPSKSIHRTPTDLEEVIMDAALTEADVSRYVQPQPLPTLQGVSGR